MNGDNMNNEKNNVENVVPVTADPAVGVSPVEQPTPVVPQQQVQPTPVEQQQVQPTPALQQQVQPTPVLETNTNPSSKEEVKIVTNANSPTNVDDIKIDTITVDANAAITAKEYVEEEKYKFSGTASESDLKLDDKPVEDEVLDEHAIKREVQMSDAEFRGKMIYMVVFLGVIILALLFMPLIFKLLHL